MPVPKSKRKRYGVLVASIIANKKRKGMSGSDALPQAKAIADKVLGI